MINPIKLKLMHDEKIYKVYDDNLIIFSSKSVTKTATYLKNKIKEGSYIQYEQETE